MQTGDKVKTHEKIKLKSLCVKSNSTVNAAQVYSRQEGLSLSLSLCSVRAAAGSIFTLSKLGTHKRYIGIPRQYTQLRKCAALGLPVTYIWYTYIYTRASVYLAAAPQREQRGENYILFLPPLLDAQAQNGRGNPSPWVHGYRYIGKFVARGASEPLLAVFWYIYIPMYVCIRVGLFRRAALGC